MTGSLRYGQDTIRYTVQRFSTRRTLGIEVHPDGQVMVRAPIDCDDVLITQRLQERAAWISRQLIEFERYRPRTPERQYIQGESHLYLGRQYRLRLSRDETTGLTLARGQMCVCLPCPEDPQQVQALLRRWYLERARAVFGEALDAGLLHFQGVDRPRLIIRSMQSRWGSLSDAGNMTLNVKLVQAPRPCIAYVVTHELCHIRHRDHDARFFKLLAQVMPDWSQRKQRLEAALI